RRVPCGVGIVLRLLAAGAVTVTQVEQAAVSAPARTNGSVKPEPPVPLLVEPVPGRTTAEKVYALASTACRLAYCDPRPSHFHFCGNPVAEGSYCEHHCALAHEHGARIAQRDQSASSARLKGFRYAAPVTLSVPPAGTSNWQLVR